MADDLTIDPTKNYQAVVTLPTGEFTIDLFAQDAPITVDNFVKLARDGFYDGVTFHRVIPGFMAQSGDPTGTGRGGSGRGQLKAEFSDVPYVRGTVGAARSRSPDSADSQFFITFGRTSNLNGQYTVWGQVTEGMEHVDAIAVGEPPANPDKIVSMRVTAAVKD